MHKTFAAITACALATIPLSHANAYEYMGVVGKWGVYGQSLGTKRFQCTVAKMDGGFGISLIVKRVPDSRGGAIVFKTRLAKGQHITGTLEFQDGKTFTASFGKTENGNAILAFFNNVDEVIEALRNEKPLTVTVNTTINTPNFPSSETINIELKDIESAITENEICMNELMDHAGVLP